MSAFSNMQQITALRRIHHTAALETHERLSREKQVSASYRIPPPPEMHCFRLELLEPVDGFMGVSVSHPIDTETDTIEIALFGADGKLVYIDRLGMDDIYRFASFGDLVDGLDRLAKNLPVYRDEDETNG